jgi:GT2 family glycosyltransferase
VGREDKLDTLISNINYQISKYSISKESIEILTECDNKEMSIGAKRQKLLNKCNAEYMVQIDDDDYISMQYLPHVIDALQSKPDCIGYLESVKIDGIQKTACHSNRFTDWANNKEGYDFVRTIFCKDVIRTDIARKIGFSDMRFGEDYDFSKRLKQSGLLKTEVFINEVMYFYESKTLTRSQHNERYGIRNN